MADNEDVGDRPPAEVAKLRKKVAKYREDFKYLQSVLEAAKKRFLTQSEEIKQLRDAQNSQPQPQPVNPASGIVNILFDLRQALHEDANKSCATFAALSVEAADAVFESVGGQGSAEERTVTEEIVVVAQIFHRRSERLMLASVVSCLGRSQRLGQTFLLKFIEALGLDLKQNRVLVGGKEEGELPKIGAIALYFAVLSRMPTEVAARFVVDYWRTLLMTLEPQPQPLNTSTLTLEQTVLASASARAAFQGWPPEDFKAKCPLLAVALKHLIAMKRRALAVEAHRVLLAGTEEAFQIQNSGGDVCEEIIADLTRNASSGYPDKETCQAWLALQVLIDANGWAWAHEQLISLYIWPLFARNEFWLRAAAIRIVSFIFTDHERQVQRREDMNNQNRVSHEAQVIIDRFVLILEQSFHSPSEVPVNVQIAAVWSLMDIALCCKLPLGSRANAAIAKWKLGPAATRVLSFPLAFKHVMDRYAVTFGSGKEADVMDKS